MFKTPEIAYRLISLQIYNGDFGDNWNSNRTVLESYGCGFISRLGEENVYFFVSSVKY